jgi:predicted RNase H-like HicB family nuclease
MHRRTGPALAGGADPTTSDFALRSLPRRELPSRRVVTVRFTAAISHEGEWYVARALEVEVTSQGHTIDEALANLREALELYFEDEALPEDIEPPIIATVQLSA